MYHWQLTDILPTINGQRIGQASASISTKISADSRSIQYVDHHSADILIDTSVDMLIDWDVSRYIRARKIFEFHRASNPQFLLAWNTSPFAQVFKLINNSWTQEWKSNYRRVLM